MGLTDSITTTSQETKNRNPYKCQDEFINGLKYFTIHGLCLVAINGGIAAGINYFSGKTVIPMKSAGLSALSQTTIHLLMIDGRSWREGWNIRRGSDMLGIEKVFAIVSGLFLTPFITYYGSKSLLHQKIGVLPTISFSLLGAVALTGFEMSR